MRLIIKENYRNSLEAADDDLHSFAIPSRKKSKDSLLKLKAMLAREHTSLPQCV